MVLARRVLESWERGRESNCKHDQQNNLLHVQSPFKCKLPKVIFFVWNFQQHEQKEVFFLLFRYVMQAAVESYKHPPSSYLLTPTSFLQARWSCSLQQCFQVVTVRMFTSVTRALSGPISILMTGMYHLGNTQSVLCTRGPSLLRTHLVLSGPYRLYRPV